MNTQDGFALNRLEAKYLIDRTIRTALARDLSALMQPDDHSNSESGYLVRSLYFDTPDYMAYHQKMAGEPMRYKVRARIYGEDPSEAEFVRLEVKSRYLNYIYKKAINVTPEQYREIECALRQHRLPPLHLLGAEGQGHFANEFFRLICQYQLEPKILIQYRRQAFEWRGFYRVRVNFDDELSACRQLDLLGAMQGARRLLQYGDTVFEAKVDNAMPSWLHMLIGKYSLQNQAFSKYCHAVRSEARLSIMGRSAWEEQPVAEEAKLFVSTGLREVYSN